MRKSSFYPETYNPLTGSGTLRNLFDERDEDVLRALEYGSTRDRQRELRRGLAPIARTYDGAHVRAIHRHLFQDVYEWAGEYRGVNMAKGSGRAFADVKTGEVDRYLVDVHRLVTGTEWSRLDRDEFGARAAEVFAHLNQAHPSGRATVAARRCSWSTSRNGQGSRSTTAGSRRASGTTPQS